jgi:hypothetical protein
MESVPEQRLPWYNTSRWEILAEQPPLQIEPFEPIFRCQSKEKNQIASKITDGHLVDLNHLVIPSGRSWNIDLESNSRPEPKHEAMIQHNLT